MLVVIVRASVLLKQSVFVHEITKQLLDVTNIKLPLQNFSQVVRFKMLLRDISARAFFLNSVRFDLRESVDIHLSSIHILIDGLCS